MARLVFDLDGTLIDSAGEIHAAVVRMLEEEGAPLLDYATVVSFVGNGLPHLVARVIEATGLDIARHEALTARVLWHYNDIGGAMTAPYPGVMDALTKLRARGHRLGICTNKPEAPANHIVGLLLPGLFDVVIGGDSLSARKPDPEPLSATAKTLGDGPIIFVGDSEVDAETAERADIPFLLFERGYRKSPVEAIRHSRSFDAFAQLPAIVEDLLGRS